MRTTDWTIEGSKGNPIYGTTHTPAESPRGTMLMFHGFMGYKEYGMFPWLAEQFAQSGFITHRCNFSHSGMLHGSGAFECIELFRDATWNRQVEDIQILVDAFRLADQPLFLFGHSRGGVSTLLAMGRKVVEPDGAIVLSSPSACLTMDDSTKKKLLDEGVIELQSGRTGQTLQIGKVFVEEQVSSPEEHNLLELAKGIEAPCLIIHGDEDPTVSVESANALHAAIPNATLQLIPHGDHVFNTTNPFDIEAKPSEQLAGVWSTIQSWLPVRQ